ncbi:MAG TPA: hypothetical protein VFW11_07435 [Cyclobacteriaceae bacterium]|nr:hypothetical protein [Cyclobacteriaceae bacterium]
MDDDKNLTAHESLEIITAMIRQAKGNARDNAFYFLLWGWVVTLANIGMYLLIQLNYPRPYVVWSIVIPAWIFTMYKGVKQGRNESAMTHLDRISAWLWVSFGIVVFTLIAFGYKINFQLNPLILIVAAIPTLVSGIILRFNPLIIGGILFWFFGIVNFLLPMPYQNLLGALAIICGYLIPGYMLKSKNEK